MSYNYWQISSLGNYTNSFLLGKQTYTITLYYITASGYGDVVCHDQLRLWCTL